MGQAMEPYDLYWIEEPVATDDISGSAEVARALGTAIAGYETEVGLYGFRELIAQRAVDIVQPDIAWAGGFTECRRIAALAHAYNMMVAPHAFSSAILLVAAMHLLASIPNGLILEFDQNPNALRRGPVARAHPHRCRWLRAPARATGAGYRTQSNDSGTVSCLRSY